MCGWTGHVRGSAPNFVPRGIPGGRNFCPAQQAEMGSPWSVSLSRHAQKPPRNHTGRLLPALGRDACDIEKDQEMALSAVGGDQAEGRLGPGRGDADGQGSGPHRRKAADPLVPHHREGGDGPAISLDAAGFDALAGGQVFPQHHAGDRIFLALPPTAER